MAEHMSAVTAEQLRAELERIARWLQGEVCIVGDENGEAPATAHDYELDQAASSLHALAARLSGMAAVQWQPMETAPTDGTEVLLCWPKVEVDDYFEPTGKALSFERVVSCWSGGRWAEPEHFEFNGPSLNDDWEYAEQPSLWMPLPAAPEVPGHG